MNFTNRLWNAIADEIYPAILAHPFIRGLTDGSLEESAFRHYVVQDAVYLREFGRGLALLASRSREDEAVMMFCDHAKNAVVVEQELHRSFLAGWGLSWDQMKRVEPAPNCLLYTSYLGHVAWSRPYYEGLGAFLPCYWIYGEVGKALAADGSPHELYQRWIDTYAGEEFGKVVAETLAVVERAGSVLTPEQQAAVEAHFVRTSRMEWLFWDMGYREQQWPV